jgi:hypothetical protein
MRLLTALAAAAALAFAAGLAGYSHILRPKQLRWGATDDEVRRPMPLDGTIPGPSHVSTRAITIRARQDEVWMWLAQMGESPRAGFYSHEWIERLGGLKVDNSNVLLPQYQHPKPGDTLDRAGNMLVKAVEEGKWLVLGPPTDRDLWLDCTWCLALYPVDPETTRLITRVRAKVNRWTPEAAIWVALMDPGVFIMERKMLEGIKQRAEALADQRRAHTQVFEDVLLEAMKYG